MEVPRSKPAVVGSLHLKHGRKTQHRSCATRLCAPHRHPAPQPGPHQRGERDALHASWNGELIGPEDTEPGAGYARDYVQAVARAEGNGFVIDGEKIFALGAYAAGCVCV